MRHILPIYLICAFSSFTFAATTTTVPQLRSASALTTKLQGDTYTAELKEGFHFNDKAPNQIQVDKQSVKPSALQARLIRFSLPQNYQEAQALLYVCDDQITYCETHQLPIKGSQTAIAKSEISKKKPAKDELGFWQGQLDKAFAIAKEKKQLVLLDFSARWCPGCVRNKNEIFNKPAFEKMSKNVVKVLVDADLFENFEILEKYQIKGIPTLVLANANEEEIDRIVGFEPMAKVQSFIGSAQKDPTPIKDLLATPVTADNATQLKVGLRLLNSGKTAESVAFLARVQPAPSELLYARVTAAQEAYEKDNAGKKDFYAKELKDALKAEPGSTRSLVWRTELVKLDPKAPEVKTIVEEGSKLADELMQNDEKLKVAVASDSVGEFKGYEKWVVAFYKADLLEAANAPEEEQTKVMSQAADLGIAYKIPVSKKGPALRQLVNFSSAKRWEEAEALANALLKQDPNNTDVKRRKIKILLALKKYKEATELGEKLIGQVEGRNEFWVAESLAKAYVGSEKKTEAKRLLTAYLARPEMQVDKMKASKKGMEDLLKSLQ